MEVRRYEPSFGIVRYGKGVEEHIRKMGHAKAIEFRVIGINNKNNPIGIDLSIIKKFGRDRLKAEIGYKSFIENIFINSVNTLKRAVKNANNIYEHQKKINDDMKGMVIPHI